MAIKHRKRADQTTVPALPNLPIMRPDDWPPSLYKYLTDLHRALVNSNTVVFGIQKNGTDMPLRSVLNIKSGATITDDEPNDRTNVTIP